MPKESILKIEDKDFWKTFVWLFKLTVSLRHEDDKEDFILSPVKRNGMFYDSRRFASMENPTMPIDGDTNGAYHIALQGLRLLKNRIKDGKIENDAQGKQNYNWLKFVQERHI